MKYSFKKSFMPLLTFLTLVANAIGVTPVYAATLVVTTLADSGAGSLRATIAGATADDTITFDAALAGQTIRLASTLVLDKNLTIDGSSLASQITISGDTDADLTGDVRIFMVDAGVTAIVKNLTISNGKGDALIPGYGSNGGAFFNQGTLTITNSTLSGNTVANPDADLESGGAIANVGTLTITNTTLLDNHSTFIGGALYNHIGATMTVANSTFSGNQADLSGGGIFNRGTLNLFNSTLSANTAGGVNEGAGLLNYLEGTLNYANNIIANSVVGRDCFNSPGGTIGTNINNWVEDGGCSASLNGDPGLDSLADNGGPNETFALLDSPLVSPALGAGDDATCAAAPVSNLDQRGRVRPQGDPSCDLGAFESSTGPAAPVVTAPVGLTSDSTPAIGGTAEPYSSVDVLHDLDPVCSDVPVNGLGNWSCVSAALPDGVIQLTVNTTAGAAGIGGTSPNTNHSFTVDTTAPTVSSIVRANANNTNATSVDFTVTFSEPVQNVDVSDFSLHPTGNVTGAAISGLTGSGATYTVTVNTGTKNGTLRLDVPNTATVNDLAGNALGGTLPFETGETYTIFKPTGIDTTGVFRPINGIIFLKNSHNSGFADVGLNYGIPGDYPVVGDWDGDGDVTIGVYRDGQFFLRQSNDVGFADIAFPFGQAGDQPVAGDWDGDGIDTIGIYRPSTGQFQLRNSNSAGAADISFYLGNVGDVGIAGDWDNDGKDTTGVFRPVNGIIFLKNTNDTGFADVALNYGIPGDKPVIGDWDNDGIDTIGVYRNGRFFLRNSNTIGFADIVFDLGNPGDMPIAGNWDGSIP